MKLLRDSVLSDQVLLSDDLTGINDKFGQTIDISSYQSITGKKNFTKGINIGDEIFDVGNNSFTVGNNLSTGSYNFFYKGIDLDTTLSTAKIYLTSSQPRYPYPFLIKNGDKTKILIKTKTLDLTNIDTLSVLSSTYPDIWNCTLKSDWRDDYNQLCIDLGENYWEKPEEVFEKLQEYVNDAFSKDESIDQYLVGTTLNGQWTTMVNANKHQYLRGGQMVKEYDSIDGNISVLFQPSPFKKLRDDGIDFGDFDYDDASFVFIDLPTLSGPANTSTYSSLNVGVQNYVARRCSAAIGKENVTESDCSIALGRKAKSKHYSSFVWGPNSETISQGNNTFTIGVNGNPETTKNGVFLYGNGIGIPLYRAIIKQLMNDDTLLKELKAKLGS